MITSIRETYHRPYLLHQVTLILFFLIYKMGMLTAISLGGCEH